jgi:hypothetical protein
MADNNVVQMQPKKSWFKPWMLLIVFGAIALAISIAERA